MIERLRELLGLPAQKATEDRDPVCRERMVKASGVTYAELVCTTATWNELAEICTPGGTALFANQNPLRLCTTRESDPEPGMLRASLPVALTGGVMFGEPAAPVGAARLLSQRVGASLTRVNRPSGATAFAGRHHHVVQAVRPVAYWPSGVFRLANQAAIAAARRRTVTARPGSGPAMAVWGPTVRSEPPGLTGCRWLFDMHLLSDRRRLEGVLPVDALVCW
ncbi:hypothetical protein ACIGXM_31640 [Kitasatospora sp. NPDC052896]|uniref:hypothetical protein n=1 Tax=Kitasatospora sp. NPDC052896 TaxID=3364061 RepID=UPI0037CC374F